MIVTSTLKDQVLAYIVNYPQHSINSSFSKISQDIGIESDTLRVILNYFEELGICSVTGDFSNDILKVIVKIQADDLYLRGGFTAKELLYQNELLKLEKELEQLCKVIPNKIDLFNKSLGIINIIKSFFV